jgi:hypothetical protein
VLQLRESSSNLDGAAAADVAEQLLSLLKQQQEVLQAAVQGQTAAQLVQLLSQHGRLAAALKLTRGLLSSSDAGVVVEVDVAAAAVAAIVQAAAAAQSQGMLTEVVQLLSEQPAGAEQQQTVLLAALDQLLANKQAPAVALLLHVLQDSVAEEQQQPLPALLEPAQLEQLVSICCNAPSGDAPIASSNSILALPSPL